MVAKLVFGEGYELVEIGDSLLVAHGVCECRTLGGH